MQIARQQLTFIDRLWTALEFLIIFPISSINGLVNPFCLLYPLYTQPFDERNEENPSAELLCNILSCRINIWRVL